MKHACRRFAALNSAAASAEEALVKAVKCTRAPQRIHSGSNFVADSAKRVVYLVRIPYTERRVRPIHLSVSSLLLLSAFACGGKTETPGTDDANSNSNLDSGRGESRDDDERDDDDSSEREAGSSTDERDDDTLTEGPDSGPDSSEIDTEDGTGSTETETPSDVVEAGASEPTDDTEPLGTGGGGGSPSVDPGTGGAGGAGGAGPAPEIDGGAPTTDLEVPEGCMATPYTEGGYCDLYIQCPNDYISSNCSDNGDAWSCSCSSNASYGNYQIEGVAGAEACEAVAALCVNNTQVVFDGPVECSAPSFDASDNYCYASTQCSQTEDLGGGITASQYTYQDANCSGDGEGGWSCYCYSNQSSSSQQFSGVTNNRDACEMSMALCDTDVLPTPNGDPVCGTYEIASDASYCSSTRSCTQSVTIDGNTAELVVTDGSNCSEDNAGNWQCACGGTNPRQLRTNVPGTTAVEAACTQTSALCLEAGETAPSGPPQCAITSQGSSGENYCSASLECSQDLVLTSGTLDAWGVASVSCENYEGVWNCGCYDNDESSNIEIPTGQDAWDTCTTAASSCVGVLTLDIGDRYSSGGVIIGGTPLSPPISMTPAPDVEASDDASER